MSYGTAGGSLKPVIALGFWESFFWFSETKHPWSRFCFLGPIKR
jgi:hypothetical protein